MHFRRIGGKFISMGLAVIIILLACYAAASGGSTVIGTGLSNPYGVAVDSSDNIYVANYGSDTLIKMDSSGTVISTWTGIGFPKGVTVDNSGNIYVANYGNDTVTKMDSSGSVTTFTFPVGSYPTGVAADNNGNIYVAFEGDNSVKKINISTKETVDSWSAPGLISDPQCLAVDSTGNIYIASYQNDTVVKISSAGAISTFYYTDTDYYSPFGVAIDGSGNIYISFEYNGKILKFDSSGVVDNKFTAPAFIRPQGIAADSSGNLYVADAGGGGTVTKLTFSVPDTTAPTISSVDASPASTTNGGVTVTVTAADASGIAATGGYSFDGGTTWQDGNSKVYSANTTIAAGQIKVKDTLGNVAEYGSSVEISNIDTTAPTISSVNASPTSATNGDVTVTVTAADASGIAATGGYSFDGGTTWQDGNSKVYTANTTIAAGQIKVKDTAGNIAACGTQIDITNIDTNFPILTAGAVGRTSDTEGTVKFTSNEAGAYYYSVVADGDGEPTIDTSGAGIACTATETNITNPTGLTAGAKNIYIKVKDVAGNVSDVLKIDIAAYVALSSDAGLTSVLSQMITAGSEAGTSGVPKTASISVANAVSTVAASDIVKHDTGATVTFYGSDNTFTTPVAGSVNLTAGAGTDVYIKVAAADGATLYYKVNINRAASSNGESGEDTTPTTTTQPANTGVEIQINGKTETAATATTTKVGDQTVITVIVDDKKVEEKLQTEGNNATVTIPVKNDPDTVVGQLNGQTVKNMENKEAVLEIKTENVTYTLPASQVNIDNVSEQIGKQVELKDIKVNISISAPTQDTVKIVENTANKNNYQVVVKPVEFEITCTSGNKTVEVSKFNGYVERMVAIPDGIDPSKITTGIVLNSDGTFSHVPTVITSINGKYYAKINSLTNSTYSVIWNPKTFKDVEKHWAKDAVNDMGSRLVISGVGNDIFEPDRDISRAEFASIIVKALGLMRPGTGKAVFADVSKADWYYDAVSIAYENGIISGYGNGNFGPMDKITREQAMTMVSRTMKITGLKVNLTKADTEKILSSLTDGANAADYARTNIAACINAGIVSGRDGKAIAPQDNITRAEVAAIVQRLLQKSKLI